MAVPWTLGSSILHSSSMGEVRVCKITGLRESRVEELQPHEHNCILDGGAKVFIHELCYAVVLDALSVVRRLS